MKIKLKNKFFFIIKKIEHGNTFLDGKYRDVIYLTGECLELLGLRQTTLIIRKSRQKEIINYEN